MASGLSPARVTRATHPTDENGSVVATTRRFPCRSPCVPLPFVPCCSSLVSSSAWWPSSPLSPPPRPATCLATRLPPPPPLGTPTTRSSPASTGTDLLPDLQLFRLSLNHSQKF